MDVRDVAEGHVLACERGRAGERYILGCRNLRLREILEILSQQSGKPAPSRRLRYAVAYAAGIFSTAWAGITGNPPRVPLDAVRMAKKLMFVSSEKAQRELGWNPRPVEEALGRAIDWFREHGYVKK